MSAVGGFLSADGRTLTLEVGEASATLVLTPLTDTAAEGAEDVVLRIDPLSFVVRTYDGTAGAVDAVAGQLGAALAKSANPMPDDAGHAAVPYWWALVALALAFCLRRGFFALPTR